MMLSLSFREVVIITGSLEKWPKKVVDCLVRLKELPDSLGTRNLFEIERGKTSSLKDSGLCKGII